MALERNVCECALGLKEDHFEIITNVDQSPQQSVIALCFIEENASTSHGVNLFSLLPCPSWPQYPVK